jgi:DNA-binding winged helix-turn-helix (wHTH) protein
VYESGEWEVDLARRELRARGVLVPIGGRAFEIIEVLVQSAGELVTKNDLMGRIWPGAIVEDNTLQFHISAIRKALGPDRGMLKTASGRGYRLLGAWTFRQESTSLVDPTGLDPVRSPAEPFQTNLPAAASDLVGRTIAVQHLRDLLSAYRVVTLTGPGGIGKTKLALEMARGLTILATSREILKIEGEHVYRVPPLDVPPEHEEPGKILDHSAVQLFIATTRAVQSDFSPDGESLPAIAAICRRLDGIPLAIDFAATRVAMLGLRQVAAGLDDRLGMLAGGRRTALPRHRTLRATLDWSYELLPEPERLVMRRLAVFAADFTAGAASLVAAGGGIAASEVVRSLANLVTKSLVTLEVGGVIARYRLHETTRAYALEKLADSSELDQVARRHAHYYRDLFERAETELDTLSAPAPASGDRLRVSMSCRGDPPVSAAQSAVSDFKNPDSATVKESQSP